MMGGGMGFTPSQVRQMDIHDFDLVAEGYRIANGGKRQAEACSDDELRDIGFEV